jgi:hypothetical protein
VSGLAALEQLVDAARIADDIEARMPSGGRPRQLPVRTLIIGLLAALADDRPAQLTRVHAALMALPQDARGRLGVEVARRDGSVHLATYRQVERTFRTMVATMDPAPVPSSARTEGDAGRAAAVAAARQGVDVAAMHARLDAFCDRLLEASIPERFKDASRSYAADWTDHASWARPVEAGRTAADPDASWGYRAANCGGTRTELFFGYYGQALTMVADERGAPVPELVRRATLDAPSSDPAAQLVGVLGRLAADGTTVGDVLVDSGYSYRAAATFAAPVRALGAELVMDLHPNDRGPKGTFEGAICANGNLWCPAVPPALLELAPLAHGAAGDDAGAHDARWREAARYKLGRKTKDDADGYHRVACPAADGKLRCPLRPESMSLGFDSPEVLSPPEHPPRCCTQATITVPPAVNAKTRQKHDYPSAAHRGSYNRRTAAERSFSSVKQSSGIDLRRGSCRLLGRTPNLIVFVCAMAVRNLRTVASFERNQQPQRQRPPPRRTRRRRYAG